MELHVFDFDGTIFHSPTPTERTKKTYGRNLYAKLMRPLQDGGLGWFQSLTSLSPPAVPKAPDLTEWYVAPTLRRLEELSLRQKENATLGSPDDVNVCVLTGRDEKYRRRIEELLQEARLRTMMSAVLLKPHETYGTVKFKLESLYTLIAKHHPQHVFYYEDRVEQGCKLLNGIRLLSRAVHPKAPESFFIYTVILKNSGEMHPAIPEDFPELARTEPCNVAIRWWEETQRRASPDPLSSIESFTFTLVLMDPALSLRTESIFTAKAEDALVAQLQYETEAHDAAHVPQKAEKGFSQRGLFPSRK